MRFTGIIAAALVAAAATTGCSAFKKATGASGGGDFDDRLTEVEMRQLQVNRTLDAQGRDIKELRTIVTDQLDQASKTLQVMDQRLKNMQESHDAKLAEIAQKGAGTGAAGTGDTEAVKAMQRELAEQRDALVAEIREFRKEREALAANMEGGTEGVFQRLSSIEKGMEALRGDLVRRNENLSSELVLFRASVQTTNDDFRKALNTLGEATYEIMRQQGQQFYKVHEEYQKALSKIEPYMPDKTLPAEASPTPAASAPKATPSPTPAAPAAKGS